MNENTMCCGQCTSGGIATELGREIYHRTSEDDRWRLVTLCPRMCGMENQGDFRVMWGICRASDALERVQCCRRCQFFS